MTIIKNKNSFSLCLIRAIESAIAAGQQDATIFPWLTIANGKVWFHKDAFTADINPYRCALECTINDKFLVEISLVGSIIRTQEIYVDEDGMLCSRPAQDAEVLPFLNNEVHAFIEEERAFLNSEQAFWDKKPWLFIDTLVLSEALIYLKELRRDCCAVYLRAVY